MPASPDPSSPALERRPHPPADAERRALTSERLRLLRWLEGHLEMPMVILGFVWLVLLVIELTHRLTPLLETITTFIWGAFILDFILKFTIAPRKLDYLKRNWLTIIALAVPALRVFRFARALSLLRATRAARGMRLLKVVGSLNRGMRALGKSMTRRGFGYVTALTLLVTFAGAAGMYAFEKDNPPDSPGLRDYGAALWWTAMIMTTLGSEYWPRTPEGRLLCLLLALYAFAVFGYVAATIATFFIGRDAEADDAELAGAKAVDALRQEIAELRRELQQALRQQSSPAPRPPPTDTRL